MLNSMRKYAKDNYLPLTVVGILFLIYFVPYLGNLYVGLDTHTLVNYPGSTNNWSVIGRQGAVLLHKLFFQSQFSMFFAEGMALVTYLLAAFVFCYLFYSIAEVSAWKSGLFFLFAMIHPVWAEQFYFTLQIFDIAVGFLFTAFALLFAYSEKRWHWGVSVVLQIFIFSIYQTFVVVYIAGCILCFLLRYIRDAKNDDDKTNVQYFKVILRLIVQFIVAFASNSIITKAFFSSSDYVTGQVRWGVDPVSTCLNNSSTPITQVFSGEGVFYTCTYPIFVVLVVLLASLFIWKYREQKGKCFSLSAVLLLQLTPFFITIYSGAVTVFRSQYILPFAIACDVLLVFELLPHERRIWQSIACCVSIFLLIGQYYQTTQLQYTHFLVRQEDERRASTINEQIVKTANGVRKPIALIGYWPTRTNGAYIYAENTHLSVFQFGWWGEPRYQELTNWSVEYMKSQGFPVTPASAEQIQVARHIAAEMPSYP